MSFSESCGHSMESQSDERSGMRDLDSLWRGRLRAVEEWGNGEKEGGKGVGRGEYLGRRV